MDVARDVKISKIVRPGVSRPDGDYYAIIWITGNVQGLKIDDVLYEDVANTMFFLSPRFHWEIMTGGGDPFKGYVMYLSEAVLNQPRLNKLQINEVRILHADSIHQAQLAPGIEVRVQSVMEMLDELITTNFNHREDAILALVNTFFVYCDGQCNIKSSIGDHNGKAVIAYRFKRLLKFQGN